jgi:hypothetical protein
MEKERARRYQTAKDLLDDLHNIEEGFPLGAKGKLYQGRRDFQDISHSDKRDNR